MGNTTYDATGYAPSGTDNLLPGLPVREIESNFATAAGGELDFKFRAAHSSAALVVNTFGVWRNEPATLWLANLVGFESLRFEAQLSTGLHGKPPHLDIVAQRTNTVLANRAQVYRVDRRKRGAVQHVFMTASRTSSALWAGSARFESWGTSRTGTAILTLRS
jgi:hypothetical protein